MARQDGVVQRIRAFFAANPEEELTFAMLQSKFGCTLWTARRAVYDLIEAGDLESVHVVRRRERGIAREEERHL
ncbi:MAG: hypothetical protein KIH64_006295 [Mycobacterium sp.]|nr:hypothetical protein [Mycobacterium sp.]